MKPLPPSSLFRSLPSHSSRLGRGRSGAIGPRGTRLSLGSRPSERRPFLPFEILQHVFGWFHALPKLVHPAVVGPVDSALVQEDEEYQIVPQAGHAMHDGHLDDEGEEVVDERVDGLVGHGAKVEVGLHTNVNLCAFPTVVNISAIFLAVKVITQVLRCSGMNLIIFDMVSVDIG